VAGRLASDVIPHIFDIFTQSPRTLDRAEGGLGIGLTLVKTIVEMHGGTVTAQSAGENQGSSFCVTLNIIEANPSGPGADGSAAKERAASAQRVLIVDDNQDASATMARLLEILGYRVRTASDGALAIALAKSFLPDAVLLDLGLPGMNGYQVCQALKDVPELKHTTIIALTGYGQSEDRRRVREAGFDFHLIKPAEVGEIRKLLELAERTRPRTG
jgi:CheY-like chemotaxis protein